MAKLCCIVAFLICVCSLSARAEDEVPYGVGSWPHVLGSQRAVVRVSSGPGKTVFVHLPWRRPDADVSETGIVVMDLKTQQRIRNWGIVTRNREACDLLFEPVTAPGEYAIYYYPLANVMATRPIGAADFRHDRFSNRADETWLAQNGLGPDRYLETSVFSRLPRAQVTRIEARTYFDRMDPMEVIATRAETDQLKQEFPAGLLIFPEDRDHPIKLTSDIPLRWVKSGPKATFKGQARRGEYYVFQLGVFAAGQDLHGLYTSATDLKNKEGSVIEASRIRCINTGGNDSAGRPFTKKLAVTKGSVQALWFVVNVPENAAPGRYSGKVAVEAASEPRQEIQLELEVSSEQLADHGLSGSAPMSRLAWLDSTIGLDDTVTAPYTNVRAENNLITCTDKQVRLGETGLPAGMSVGGHDLLAGPIELSIEAEGNQGKWDGSPARIVETKLSQVRWQATQESRNFTLTTQGRMEYDGYGFYQLTLKAKTDCNVADMALHIPMRRDYATYMMGLDSGPGGARRNVSWKWQDRPTNKIWLGSAEAGLRCKLRGAAELENVWVSDRPEVNGIPESWSNKGAGGCTVTETANGRVIIRAYTGRRSFKAGEEIQLNFSLLMTPLKQWDPQHQFDPKQWNYRFSMMGVDHAVNQLFGANNVTAFHGSAITPKINYPFGSQLMKSWTESAHKLGMQARLYYKIGGEISNHADELWALRSLGHEVLAPGAGGGGEWLMEHLRGDYQPMWYCNPHGVEGPADSAVATTGESRWNNFYAASLSWLIKENGIDGMYYDGLGYSRTMIQRVRRLADAEKSNVLLDFHTGNTIIWQSNGYNDVMEHLPYFNLTWIGEGYNYDYGPDFYMTELSGIPFGVPNTMLQGGGNPWRGMLYGMACRFLESQSGSPTTMWKFWDRIRMQDSRMIGYWDKKCPVKTNSKHTLATVYRFPDKALIALASWEPGESACRLTVDWKSLGMDASAVTAYAPEIPEYQAGTTFDLSKPIMIPKGRGWLIVVEPKRQIADDLAFDSARAVRQPQSLDPKDRNSGWQVHIVEAGQSDIDYKDAALKVAGPRESVAYMQRACPGNLAAVECKITVPTLKPSLNKHNCEEGRQTPGISLIWPNGQKVRIFTASLGVWAIDDGVIDHMYKKAEYDGAIAPTQEVGLRITLNTDYVCVQTSRDGVRWETLRAIPRSFYPGMPSVVQIGKTARDDKMSHSAGPRQEAVFRDFALWMKP